MQCILEDETEVECLRFWIPSVTDSQKICASNQVLEFSDSYTCHMTSNLNCKKRIRSNLYILDIWNIKCNKQLKCEWTTVSVITKELSNILNISTVYINPYNGPPVNCWKTYHRWWTLFRIHHVNSSLKYHDDLTKKCMNWLMINSIQLSNKQKSSFTSSANMNR